MGEVVVVLKDDPIGRALEQVIRLLYGPAPRVLRAGPDEVATVRQALRDEDAVLFLDILRPEGGAPPIEVVARLPLATAATALAEAMARARCVSVAERCAACWDFFGVRQRLRREIHDVSGALNRRRRENAAAAALGLSGGELERLRADLRRFQGYLERVERAEEAGRVAVMAQRALARSELGDAELRELQEMLAGVEQALFPPVVPDAPSGSASAAPSAEPCRTILAVDDDGFSREFVEYLEACGYRVDVKESCEEAADTMEAVSYDVLVCDLQFGNDPGAGLRLMERVRQGGLCRRIIALSGSPLSRNDAPAADACIGGAMMKRPLGAQRIHEVIQSWTT